MFYNSNGMQWKYISGNKHRRENCIALYNTIRLIIQGKQPYIASLLCAMLYNTGQKINNVNVH